LIGPAFEELLEVASEYVDTRVRAQRPSEIQDIGIYFWIRQALDVLETAIRNAPVGTGAVPVPGQPAALESRNYRRRMWTGITAEGKNVNSPASPAMLDLRRSLLIFWTKLKM
jgi:hypothetical protein